MRNSVIIAVLVLIPVSFAHAQIPTAERDALIALYNSTDGANWSDNSGWLGTAGTECTWYGVACSGGHVQTLWLSSNQLNGGIPPELGDLSGLTSLHLYSNQLSGGIPPVLGSLLSLTTLFLDRNQLSGEIPPQLGDLSSLTGLHLYSNQLGGGIPVQLGNLLSLTTLYLDRNQLSGEIPPHLGDLSSLTGLHLYSNELSGGIPTQLGHLLNLTSLFLASNQLSGEIPPQLGNLTSLTGLHLYSNQLSGGIPPQLGDLSSLTTLFLYSNQLSGGIPSELENLSMLPDGSGLDLRWNALHSDNATLIAFLNQKQNGGDWQSTQTIAPENLTVDSLGDHTVWLTWDAVSYQSDRGGYSVFSAPTGSGAWTTGGWTEEKTDTTYPVTWLDPATIYDLAVVTYTDPHAFNQNVVNSDFSLEVMATTASLGCAQPVIEIAWGDPITLFVPGSYDSYLWSTGVTSSSIVINPLFDQWYWVRVTSAGSCNETVAVWVDPATPVFLDGFESGDMSAWSNAVGLSMAYVNWYNDGSCVSLGTSDGPFDLDVCHQMPGESAYMKFDCSSESFAWYWDDQCTSLRAAGCAPDVCCAVPFSASLNSLMWTCS